MFTFCGQGLHHLFQVGTVFPSSRWLARAMTRSLRPGRTPKRVLEVGPGTGAITRMILPSLGAGDEFHLVEINPRFCRHIETGLLRPYRAANPAVRVDLHCDSITSAPVGNGYDVVVCSLPLFAFTASDVRAILDRLAGFLAADGELTYMRYAGVRFMKSPFVPPARRRELRRIDALCRSLGRRHEASYDLVLLNLLPSYVVRLRALVPHRAVRDGGGPGRRGKRKAGRSAVPGGCR